MADSGGPVQHLGSCPDCGGVTSLTPTWNLLVVQIGRRFYRKMMYVCDSCNAERTAPQDLWPEVVNPPVSEPSE